MTNLKQQRIKEVFAQACSAPPEEREAVVDRLAADDAQIRAEVLELLLYHDDTQAPTNGSPGEGFEAGFLFADRYRIINELGRGGMGRVYRAHDVVLDVPVALKLLNDLSPTFSERLLEEVRLARSVSHPNVCKVFDIGLVGEDRFLTMEYVDGEDLEALLRRIGRLPSDKLLDIARQLCAGIAAAHAKGIVHRDLKPANIMIDGEGKARITDFGIATTSSRAVPVRRQPGTPAYMAPELLSGCSASEASDLYSLGLLLYEMATGKPAFRGDTPVEVAELHSSTELERPSLHVEDLDPRLEKTIIRLLERNPADRPKSALAVAAMLPGGDPLSLAREVGETPAPEIVAAAPGEKRYLTPGRAVAVGFVLVLLLAGVVALADQARKAKMTAEVKAPAALAEQASEILRSFGHKEGKDREWGFVPTCADGETLFWYREGPKYLQPPLSGNPWSIRVGLVQPWALDDDMVQVFLDGEGRLQSFYADPPDRRRPEDESYAEVDWEAVIAATGLGAAQAEPGETVELPPVWADSLRAWTGPDPSRDGKILHVDAASAEGAVVFVDASNNKEERKAKTEEVFERSKFSALVFGSFLMLLVLAAAVGANANVRSGRGDTTGARQLAVFVIVLKILQGLLYASHVPLLHVELGVVVQILGGALVEAAVLAMIYLAMEPTARRLCPEVLIGWSRLQQGRLRDPVIGQSLILGALVGAVWTIVVHGDLLIGHFFGLDAGAGMYLTWGLDSAMSVRLTAADMLYSVSDALKYSLAATFLLAFLLKILKRKLTTMVAFLTIVGLLVTMDGTHPALSWLTLGVTLAASTYWILTRAGLLAYLVAMLTYNILLFAPTGIGRDDWYTSMGILSMLIVAGIGAIGMWLALTTKEASSC